MRTNIYLFILLIFPFTTLLGQSNTTVFDQANAAYNGGNYSLAIEKYESILNDKLHSAEVYFNLGNAHYRLGNVAESVYYFEQAKRLDPMDKTILNNSSFANNMTQDAIDKLPETQIDLLQQKVLAFLTLDQWTIITLVFAWMGALLFFVYRWNNHIRFKRLFFSLTIIFVLTTLVSLGLTQSKLALNSIQKAVIFEREIEIWGEPNTRADILFLLHEGTVVEVVDALEGWSKVKLANGSEGWIQNSGIKHLN